MLSWEVVVQLPGRFRGFPYISASFGFLIFLLGAIVRPEGRSLIVYLWISLVLSFVSLFHATFSTDWKEVSSNPRPLKALIVLLLYCGLAISFSFVYTLTYLADSTVFTTSSDISLKEIQTEVERVVVQAGGARRLSFATADAFVRDPAKADSTFVQYSLVSTTPAYMQNYFGAVANPEHRGGIGDAIRALTPLQRFMMAEAIRSKFLVPDYTDKQIGEQLPILKVGLETLVQTGSVTHQLRDLGFIANLPPEVREIYEKDQNGQSKKLVELAAQQALSVLNAGEEVFKEESFSLRNEVRARTRTWQTYSHFLYFSFVTVSTIGFGDIAPNGSIARIFVIMEVLSGVYIVSVALPSVLSSSS